MYNSTQEIIGVKNHWGYQCVNLYYPGDKGLSSGWREQQQLPLILLGAVQSAILCLSLSLSLTKNWGQRSRRMVISSLGCVCFHFAHVCADKVWLAKKSQSRAGFCSSCSLASFRNDGKSCTRPLVTAQTDGGNQWLVDMLQYTEISPHPNPSLCINGSTSNKHIAVFDGMYPAKTDAKSFKKNVNFIEMCRLMLKRINKQNKKPILLKLAQFYPFWFWA